jgi:hypothetical protein
MENLMHHTLATLTKQAQDLAERLRDADAPTSVCLKAFKRYQRRRQAYFQHLEMGVLA